MTNRRLLPLLVIAATAFLAGFAPLPATIPAPVPYGSVLVRSAEQDAAYRGVNSGRMLSLDQIRAIVSRKVKGEYMGVEIDDGALQEGGYVYRLTYRRPNGAIVRVDVNAQNGQILGMYGS